ncbi:MAG: aminopeptidase P family protein [Candidatus Omnitrophota bacterium]|nr:MAG: aminopeptidase P family protein [Candidatus Omnitrophota bacterium]
MNARLAQIKRKLCTDRLDGIVLFSSANVSYAAGYPCRDTYLLITSGKSLFLTDTRYSEELKDRTNGFLVKTYSGSLVELAAKECLRLGLKRVGFEGRHISYSAYALMRKRLGRKVTLVPKTHLIEELRSIKAEDEIALIKRAVDIAKKAMYFAQGLIVPGRREIEVAAELERFVRFHGAWAAAFPVIVASGKNSAFPHHITSMKRIEKNEPVLIDMGVDYQGYKSDLTRVFNSGKISNAVKKTYEIVLRAQKSAISKIKPGTSAKVIDATARQYIARCGFGGFFGHSVGHGVGLEVHEDPRISKKSNELIRQGMVFTVEPGIYLYGKYGIRIEDMVLVTAKGVEVL